MFCEQNDSNIYDLEGVFECLKCPVGCDTCEDDRPCVVSLNWLMRTAILIMQCAIILMLPIVGLFTWKYSEVKVSERACPLARCLYSLEKHVVNGTLFSITHHNIVSRKLCLIVLYCDFSLKIGTFKVCALNLDLILLVGLFSSVVS